MRALMDRLLQTWPAEDALAPTVTSREPDHGIGHRSPEPTIEALRGIAIRYRSMEAASACPVVREELCRIASRFESWADRLSSGQ